MLLGFLYRPGGSGPFPAMVLLHGCVGVAIGDSHWAELFQSRGYVALIVDSLSPRRIKDACADSVPFTARDRAGDPFGALAYLRSLPYIETARIGVIGWSQGGGATLLAARAQVVDETRIPGGGFRAAVAFYPGCEWMSKDIHIPLLLLLAAHDDWTPPGNCESTAKQMQQEGSTVVVQVFGAYHGFDFPGPTTAVKDKQGHTQAYDPIATSSAEKLVENFLAQYLR